MLLSSLAPLLASEQAKLAANSWVDCEGDTIRYHTSEEQAILAAHPRVSYEDVVQRITAEINDGRDAVVHVADVRISIQSDGNWNVER